MQYGVKHEDVTGAYSTCKTVSNMCALGTYSTPYSHPLYTCMSVYILNGVGYA